MELNALIEQMIQNSVFQNILNDPLAQFGTKQRRYLGAELLPEVTKPENQYTEAGIRYRSVIANDGTRYSPVSIRGGAIHGEFNVQLGYSDSGSQFTAADYDALIRLIRNSSGNDGLSMQGMVSLTNWFEQTILRPLLELNEKQRWQAIVDAAVVRQGDNKYEETVSYSNPANHRAAAAHDWSNNSYDPMDDIIGMCDLLKSKGYTPGRCFAGRTVITKLKGNTNIKKRLGVFSIIDNVVAGLAGNPSMAELNNMLMKDNIPPIEEYNLQYATSTTTAPFLKTNVFVIVATTGREQILDQGDSEPLPIQDTLGYTGVGTCGGREAPGRVTTMETFDRKPPRIEAEGNQCSFPVITEPEAITVITGIA